MSFYLLDRPNPRANGGFHGYVANNQKTCIVVHTAETTPTARSAQAIANYFATTDVQASYHTVVDSHSTVLLLPYKYTAFHCRAFNSPSLGLSFATRAADWGRNLTWDRRALARGAAEANKMATTFGIPFREISAAQARAGVKGFVTHAQMDPGRRTDPGVGFGFRQFLDSAAGLTPVAASPIPVGEDNDMLKYGDTSEAVRQWQHTLNRFMDVTGGGEDGGGVPFDSPKTGSRLVVDGNFGDSTEKFTRHSIARCEHWVLKHTIYADSRNVTAQTQSFVINALEEVIGRDK